MRIRRNKGQSLFELVFALGIIALVLVVLVSMAAVTVRNTSFARNKAQANKYTQEAIEWVRGQRDSDWDSFYARASTPTWCMDTLSWDQIGACGSTVMIPDTVFIRELDLTAVDVNTVQASSRTSWEDAQGFHEVRSSTLLTNWRAQP